MDSSSTIAEQLADRIGQLDTRAVPVLLRAQLENLVLDVFGLCLGARKTDYVRSARNGWDEPGPCTRIGHARGASAAAAAFLNGTAAHGEDFDDTFEGGPVHAGAVIVPAVLAACEQEGRTGAAALRGIGVGVETLCRLSLVKPKAIHRAGFHPTAVLGACAAAAGVGAALRLDRAGLVNAMGIAGSFASGIIEYLAEGAWTKRLHTGWAAQSGLRAARLARAGFVGPRSVFEGAHGLMFAFARAEEADWAQLLDGFGTRWVAEGLAFKPYPCGTMIQPYVDCALKLRTRATPDQIETVLCRVAATARRSRCSSLSAPRSAIWPQRVSSPNCSEPYRPGGASFPHQNSNGWTTHEMRLARRVSRAPDTIR